MQSFVSKIISKLKKINVPAKMLTKIDSVKLFEKKTKLRKNFSYFCTLNFFFNDLIDRSAKTNLIKIHQSI